LTFQRLIRADSEVCGFELKEREREKNRISKESTIGEFDIIAASVYSWAIVLNASYRPTSISSVLI
jgi:hypothetical protein